MSGKKLLLLALAALALLLGGAFLLWNEGTKADLEAAGSDCATRTCQ